ncbi:hypothetical protein EMIHUDRAFT_420120 [Emiliania huxleyi CCMP1516]|uniref:RRM domain-containing protein n=2 Tax=Emiliania huxleyi TaxID=2903 RepID=A0A0D3K775_EMIH1|nr:hypothetical protein EMIHUDRAFT_420120 [Emiliania huxleyi CCMP1516]EOD31610.1 hypothetical protein EMIHUDRAFT_420120 [Emiliania huxleyi CCMP1516]|eukprot:XP_005784039.1 hypothetical protein EMIHUDRAFT_420120 [Emiliania huxleyi CCMP1516]
MAIVASLGEDAVTLGESFPIICESCLGPNPYVRMLKGVMGKECKISGRPFTSFRWQGQHKRWKETCISPEVAREKNVCQSCVNDLEYGVPFHVRDQVMAALGKEGAVSDVNKEFWWHNKKQEQEDDGGAAGGGLSTYDQLRDSVEQLREFAALDPGPVLRPRRDTPLTPEEQERLRQRRLAELRPPEDKSISSLFVGSIPPGASDRDLRPYFQEYGPVKKITLDTAKMSAYVTYERRADAEQACRALHANLNIKGSRVRVMWARKGTRAAAPPGTAAAAEQPQRPAKRPHLPPGVAPPPGARCGHAYPSTNPDSLGARPDLD